MIDIVNELRFWMRYEWFMNLIVPGLILVAIVLWKGWTRPAGPVSDDYVIGLDLTANAIGAQLAIMASHLDNPALFNLLSHRLFLVVGIWILIGLNLYFLGYDPADGTTPDLLFGILLPAAMGLIAVLYVFFEVGG